MCFWPFERNPERGNHSWGGQRGWNQRQTRTEPKTPTRMKPETQTINITWFSIISQGSWKTETNFRRGETKITIGISRRLECKERHPDISEVPGRRSLRRNDSRHWGVVGLGWEVRDSWRVELWRSESSRRAIELYRDPHVCQTPWNNTWTRTPECSQLDWGFLGPPWAAYIIHGISIALGTCPG